MLRFLARWMFPPSSDVCFQCGRYRPVNLWDAGEEVAWCAECAPVEVARLMGAAPNRLRVVGRRAV